MSAAGSTTDSSIFVPILVAALDQPRPAHLFQRPKQWEPIVQHYQEVEEVPDIHLNSVGTNTKRESGARQSLTRPTFESNTLAAVIACVDD